MNENIDENLEKLADYFLQNTNVLSQLSVSDRQDVLQLASTIANKAKDQVTRKKGYDLLYKCCFSMDLDIKELWNIYWMINRVAFTDYKFKIAGNIDELYRFIFKKIYGMVDTSFQKIDNPDSNIVVMVTSQFLSEGHAPTRRILDYAYTLLTSLHKSVLIINDSGLNFYPCNCIDQGVFPIFIDSYNDLKKKEYKGVEIPFYQIPTRMPDIYAINETLSIIYELKPGLVYNIGGSSLVTDLCSIFTKTASFPCSTNIPVTMSQYLLVGRMINETDKDRLQRLEPYQQIVETVVNFQLPADHSFFYSRSQFGLKETDFVIGIVGNRLDTEIDDTFIDIMNKILSRFEVQFLLIGNVSHKEKIFKNVEHPEWIHFADALKEADQAIELFDIYCNPIRNGGGRSGFEALAHGVPVVTTKYGDVYYTCGEDFSVRDDEEYIQIVEKYVTDKQYMMEMEEKAKKRSNYLSDLSKTQGDILKQIL